MFTQLAHDGKAYLPSILDNQLAGIALFLTIGGPLPLSTLSPCAQVRAFACVLRLDLVFLEALGLWEAEPAQSSGHPVGLRG